jgi:hypothetical protein
MLKSNSNFAWLARRWRALVLSFALLCPLTTTTSAAQPQAFGQVLDQVYLNVPYQRQNTQVWCWVAAAQMVAQYYNVRTPSQCEMLSAQYGAPCCQNPAYCTRPGYMQEIQALIANFGLRYSAMGPPTDGWSLLRIFKSGSPVVLYVNNSHFVVADGMKVVSTPNGPLGIVRILDPYVGIYEEDLPSLWRRWGASIYIYN